MEEIWIPIKGCDYYLISNFGNVKSIDRVLNTKKGISRTYKGQTIKPTVDSNGYLRSPIRDNSRKSIHVAIHRLIMLNFYPVENSQNLEVNHKDGNKKNNHILNLEWVTRSENLKHSYTILNRIKPHLGKPGKYYKSSKKIDQYTIKNIYVQTFNSIGEAAKYLNKYKGSIIQVLKGNQKSAYGYIWKYTDIK